MIGLDCATPELLFGPWLDELPNLRSIVRRSGHGPLRSTVPPITVPAWSAMMSSQDPGMLGIYGFRNRRSYGYQDLHTVNASHVHAKMVWNHLSRRRLRSIVFGVPQTYPPKPLDGLMVSCFLTPDKRGPYTYPAEASVELEACADGDYRFDVEDFRTHDKGRLLHEIHLMTERRFRAFRHFYAKDRPEFAIIVEIGSDRMHHAFWRYMATDHRSYEPGSPFASAILEYYSLLDREIGKTLDMLDGRTSVMLVSDHGAKTMRGAVCINEWLRQNGYLTLHKAPTAAGQLRPEMVDWGRTIAWGEGGYHGRIFLNIAGREPEGVVAPDEVDAVAAGLAARIAAIPDEEGNPLATRVYRPRDVYREVTGMPPDLIVYFGDLAWRCSGSVGTGSIHIFENDTGPDDANHSEHGILVWDALAASDRLAGASLYDVAPSILDFFGVPLPAEMIGNVLRTAGRA